MNSYNLAALPEETRASIEAHKVALFADFKGERLTVEQEAIIIAKRFKRGAIKRDRVKRIIESSFHSEELRVLINKFMGNKNG